MVTKMKARSIVLMVLASVLSLHSRAQVSGPVTVPSTAYPTLNDVINALNAQGVGPSGATINLTANSPQTVPTGGYRLGSATLNASLLAGSPLVINGNGNTLTAPVGQGGADGIFTLLGTNYVTINSLHLLDTNTFSYVTQMDWGYGLVKLNNGGTYDGCQYNTINNCNITLNRSNANSPTATTNGGGAAGAAFGGSKGIAFLNVTMPVNPTDLLVQSPITTTDGANSYNTVKGCNIQNCNIGVYMYGYNAATPYTLYDQNNTIGGYGATDGNSITNYGGAAFEAAGVYIFGYANNALVRGNTINNTANGGVAAINTLDGVYHGAAVGSNVTVAKNSLTLTESGTAPTGTSVYGTYVNCGGTNPNQISVDTNSVTVSYGATANNGNIYGFYFNSGAVANLLSCTANQVSISSAANGNIYGFNFLQASIGANPKWNIDDNKVDGITRTSAPTLGSTYGFSQTGILIGGTQFLFRRNKFTNVSVPYCNNSNYGVYPTNLIGGGSPYPVRTISYDTVSNINAGGAWFYGFYLGANGVGSVINNNLVTNITDSATVYGIGVNSGTAFYTQCYNNTISNIVNKGTTNISPTYGLYLALFSNGAMDVFNNTITNFQTANTTTTLNNGIELCGIYMASGLNANLYNNIISDFKAPYASGFSPVYGIYINTGNFYQVYHNTINIGVGANGAQLTSTGANFGATGIYYQSNGSLPSASVSDIRNNIVRVNSAANGTGAVCALRASYGQAGVRPSGLATTSNGNILWEPGDAQMYYYAEYGGTVASAIKDSLLVNKFSSANDPLFNSTCSKYKAFMYPAETNTFVEDNLAQISTGVYAPTGATYAKGNTVPTTAPAVTFDYNNVTRSTPADAGALQFTGTPKSDVTPPAISYTLLAGKTYCVAAPTLTATITDASGVNTTSNPPRLYYRKASEADTFGVYPGNNNSSFNGWKYVSATNAGSTFSFAMDYAKLATPIAGGDSIIYFVVAQDNAGTANVGVTLASLAPGYCPSSVNLAPAAGPTTSQVKKNAYFVIPQPALPTITPASASVCQGASTKLTAAPISSTKLASLGNQSLYNGASSWPTPFANYNGSGHEQYLILASELIDQGLTFGNITSLAFNMQTAYPAADSALKNFTIQMANTSVNNFTVATFVSSGFTQVYSNTYTPPAATGWATINFTTPFYWDGVSNVVVDVSFLNCSVCNTTSSCTTYTTGNGQVYRTATPFGSTITYHTSNNCTVPSFVPSGSVSNTTINERPDMQFMGTQAFRVNWAPVGGLYKDSLMTMPITATDTTPVVYAGPATNNSYAVMNVFSGCNSIPGTPTPVTVNPVPTVTTTPANTASFCGGSNTTLSGSTATGNTYQWNLAGAPISNATNASYTTSTTGSYTFTATNSFGCSKTSPAIVVSNAAPPTATATAAGATTFCQGGSVAINANTGSGLTYQWYDGANLISNATSSTYNATTSGNYNVRVYNAGNCFTTSNTVPVTVNPLNTTVTASGSTSFCTGSNVTLSVPTAANQMYQWKNNGNPINGETNASYVASATGNYSVTVTNSISTCTGTSSVTAVTVGTGPVAAIAPSGTINTCAGNTVTLTTSPVAGVTYQWLLNGNPISNATNSAYGATATGSYSLRVYSSPTCFTTSSATNIIANPLPSVATTPVAGPTTVCQNGSAIISAPTGSNLSYQWSFNGNPINGGTNYNYSAGAPGTYSVYVIDNQTGCDATSGNIVMSQLAAPTAPVVTGGGAICAGDSLLLSSTQTGGLTYQWRNGSTAISGATGNTYYAKVLGNYTIVATNSNGCSASSNAVAVTQKPLPNVTTTPAVGNSYVCTNHPITLSVPTGTNLTYQWKVGGNAISGATNNTYVTATGGTYTVTVNNSQTGCTATSGNVSLSPLTPPSVSITGPTSACMGDSVTYVATNNSNFIYQWQQFGTNISGATSANYKTPLTGTYRVIVTDALNACTDTSNVIALSLINLPGATITGSSTICAGDTAMLVVGSGNGYSYQWKLNSNNISGANGNTYTATVAGSYVVTVTNASNCNATSNQFQVTVNALPTVTIANNQSVLSTTGSYSTYQWYFNNTAIAGATSASYSPGQDGDYYLAVTDNNGCSGKSNVITMTGLGVRDLTASGIKVRVYPNPTTGILNIDAPVKVNVTIRDLSGKVIKRVGEVHQVDLGDIAAGVYMMTVSDTNGVILKVDKVFKTQ